MSQCVCVCVCVCVCLARASFYSKKERPANHKTLCFKHTLTYFASSLQDCSFQFVLPCFLRVGLFVCLPVSWFACLFVSLFLCWLVFGCLCICLFASC